MVEKRMNEKVLGFKKRVLDLEILCANLVNDLNSLAEYHETKKPVVSVEFLKDWCKGNQFGSAPPRVNVEELLKAVEEKE